MSGNRRPAPRLRLLILTALVAGVLNGCAPYGRGMQPVLDRLSRGDPGAALAHLEKSPREQDGLYQLERGLLLRLAGRHAESSAAFERAQAIAEDLYTKSVSREAAALAVTDRIRAYLPPTHELLLARQYEARNYLDQLDLEGAAVEARRIGLVLDEIEAGSRNPPAAADLLAPLTAALVLEAAGEPDNALVFYRRLLRSAGGTDRETALPLPDWLAPRVRRLARFVGVDITGELPADSAAEMSAPPPGFTAVVFVEHGFVPPRGELEINVPILKTESGKDREWIGSQVGERVMLLRSDAWPIPDQAEIAYWLDIALPVYGPDPYVPPAIEVSGRRWRGEATVAADVAASARASLEREMPAIALRAAIRALIKYTAHHQAEKEIGEPMGILVNILGIATEQAETRTWLSLPHEIDLAVIDLPSAADTVTVSLRDHGGWERTKRIALARPPGCSFGFGSYRAWP